MDSLKQETGIKQIFSDEAIFCLNPDRSTCTFLFTDDSGNDSGFIAYRKTICEKCIWVRK
ncbi:MAG: hypothetical protein PHC34_04510 [Candidatus Gastranaerophilales bacterium]|nr:hypothetical protein [Candidatus Gastranaerophilales bacterium]